jgi:hypothetical protein
VAVARTAAERRAHSERYGGNHRRERRRWESKVRKGVVPCSRCGELIQPGQRWDLDHADDGDPRSYLGPAHSRCNRAVAGPPRTSPRPSSSRRGYGKRHKRLRAAWAPQVAAGGVCCARCGEPIVLGEPWDLGHDDYDRTKYRGPEHRACNRATAGRRAPEPLVASRVW